MEKNKAGVSFLDFLNSLLVHVLGDEDQRQRCHVALRREQRKEGKEGSERRGGNTDLPGSVTQMVDTSEDPPGQGRMNRVCAAAKCRLLVCGQHRGVMYSTTVCAPPGRARVSQRLCGRGWYSLLSSHLWPRKGRASLCDTYWEVPHIRIIETRPIHGDRKQH